MSFVADFYPNKLVSSICTFGNFSHLVSEKNVNAEEKPLASLDTHRPHLLQIRQPHQNLLHPVHL
jgi:hypothetical protein